MYHYPSILISENTLILFVCAAGRAPLSCRMQLTSNIHTHPVLIGPSCAKIVDFSLSVADPLCGEKENEWKKQPGTECCTVA